MIKLFLYSKNCFFILSVPSSIPEEQFKNFAAESVDIVDG